MRITWLDRAAVRAELDEAVRELARRHPEIERVILFGSFATGRSAPGSDIDLLVVLASSDRPFLNRIPVYTPRETRIAVEVFPYTRSELDEMLGSRNWFLRRALAEGLELPLGR